MKTLFLGHIEPCFAGYFDPDYLSRVCRYIRRGQFNKVVHFTNDELHPVLYGYVTSEIKWGWGYEPSNYDVDERQWVIDSPSHHEYTWVPPELRIQRPTNERVFLGGGAEDECLLDLEAVLQHVGIRYRKVPKLVW